MKRAIQLAREADHRTSPNPMVGAVVLDREGALAGEGFHRRKGEPHAEQVAIDIAGGRARGGTIYTNLEPCMHRHRSPSCVDAVLAAGIARVVVAMEDPDSRVRGAGIARLRAAGVEVKTGVLEREARRLNEFYIWHRRTGRPFVSAKYAMTLDGKIATSSGESRWITGEAARRHGHRLRHVHDAILVGVNTVIADDPKLTTRDAGPDARQPIRVVLDSTLRTPPRARVLVGERTLIAATAAGRIDGAEVMVLPSDGGRVALGPLLDELGRRNIISLLVEGGAETHASFFDERLVNRVYAYIAPKLVGGREAPGPVGGGGVARLADAHHLHDTEVLKLDDDVLITGYLDVHGDS